MEAAEEVIRDVGGVPDDIQLVFNSDGGGGAFEDAAAAEAATAIRSWCQ